MTAKFSRLILGTAALCAAVHGGGNALAQATATQPAPAGSAAPPPAAPKPHHRRKPQSLEMDVNGTGEAPTVAGPNTSTQDATSGDLSGSTGAGSSAPMYPTPSTPAPQGAPDDRPALAAPGDATPRP